MFIQPNRPLVSRRRVLLAMLIAFVLLALTGISRVFAAQVSGNEYTSPQFGYTVSWDDSWFVMSEETQPGYWDLLMITNGITTLAMYGESNVYPTFESGLATFIAGFNSDPAVSEFAPMRDDAGDVIRESSETGALAAFTYTYTHPDGTAFSAVAYMEVRGLDSGRVLFGYSANMPLSMFETQRALPGVTLPGDQPAPDPIDEIVAGEAAPAFVSGTWRIAVARAAVSQTFPDLALDQKAGKEWAVLILDVTNWSDRDAELSARDFVFRPGPGLKSAKVARSTVSRLAELLGGDAPGEGYTYSIAAGESVHIALAFQVPAGGTDPVLALGDELLPLSEVLEPSFDMADLPVAAGPPDIRTGKVLSAPDSQSIHVQIEGRAAGIRIHLLGVDPLADGACVEDDAADLLDELIGATVLVEEDAALTGGSVPARYLWLLQPDGTRTLLNQRLIADGLVNVYQLPADARFGMWMEFSAVVAEESGVGLWGSCEA